MNKKYISIINIEHDKQDIVKELIYKKYGLKFSNYSKIHYKKLCIHIRNDHLTWSSYNFYLENKDDFYSKFEKITYKEFMNKFRKEKIKRILK